MEIQPASIEQVQASANGKWHVVDADVGGISKRLREIDETLRLRVSDVTGHYVVYQEWPQADGSTNQHLVLTAQECDDRLVKRVQKISSTDYDYSTEIGLKDARATKAAEDKLNERAGEAGERLAHALRKDLNVEKDSARSRKNWGKA